MVKMEGNEEGLDEWKSMRLSPNGLISGFGDDDNFAGKSFADIFYGGEAESERYDHVKEAENSIFDVAKASAYVKGNAIDVGAGSGVSIAERRAMKCGFNAAKISSPRFRTSTPFPSSGVRSPCLTIPPGISPRFLLDSPILLPNSQLSPTTGTFAPPFYDTGDSHLVAPTVPADANNFDDGGLSSMCNVHAGSSSMPNLQDLKNHVVQTIVAPVDYQTRTSELSVGGFEFPASYSKVGINSFESSSPVGIKVSDDLSINSDTSTSQPFNLNPFACVEMPTKIEASTGDDSGTLNLLDGDQKEIYSGTGTTKIAEDGFNWRKYGQKQVKGSDYPRSYYKCTHPNCTVKKKVERSLDGRVTEIIYSNGHNHPKPQPCLKFPFGSVSFCETSDIGDDSSSCVRVEGSTDWRNIQADTKIRSDWRIDPLEASVVSEVSSPLSITQGKSMGGVLESVGTPELSSTLASYDDEEVAEAPEKLLLGDDHENEPDLKRRKKDGCSSSSEIGFATRALREPKVVVQIESEIDILDDGYRWRKYGQKVVKGNPNPRSYYKCTSAGCNVRKHVERASHDLKFVITTYEGKHNHEVPAARNSNHSSSGSSSLPLPPSANMQSTLSLPRNPHLVKPEPHDLPPHYHARFGGSTDLFRPNFLAAGAPSLYQMRFPTLPNSAPYCPFGLATHSAYTNSIMPVLSELRNPLQLGFPHSVSAFSDPERPISASGQSLYMGQQLQQNDVKLFRSKQEHGDESFCDIDMQSVEHSNSYSVDKNIMGSFSS